MRGAQASCPDFVWRKVDDGRSYDGVSPLATVRLSLIARHTSLGPGSARELAPTPLPNGPKRLQPVSRPYLRFGCGIARSIINTTQSLLAEDGATRATQTVSPKAHRGLQRQPKEVREMRIIVVAEPALGAPARER